MSRARQALGKIGEDLACQELERRGYAIVARRYRRRGGELDIVARDGATLVFVEVKARCGPRFGEAAEAVTARSAGGWRSWRSTICVRHRLPDCPCRFDVVSIQLTTGEPDDRGIQNAFDAAHVIDSISTDGVPRCLNSAKIPSPAAGSSSPPSARSGRTISASSAPTVIGGEHCPFCAGHEDDDAARGARVPPERQRAERARLGPARRAQQVSGAAGRRHARPRRRGHVRSDERHRRARGDHRDARSRQDAGDDVGAGDRAGAVGVPRARARSEAATSGSATSWCSRTTARRPARRSSTRTRS